MSTRSKSTLFLMEQVVVIAIFAFCAAVCVKILVVSYLMTVDAVDTTHALHVAESAAASHRAFRGDAGGIADTLGGAVRVDHDTQSVIYVFYDSQWRPTSGLYGDGSVFMLRLAMSPDENNVVLADITVSRIVEPQVFEELVQLTAATRQVAA